MMEMELWDSQTEPTLCGAQSRRIIRVQIGFIQVQPWIKVNRSLSLQVVKWQKWQVCHNYQLKIRINIFTAGLTQCLPSVTVKQRTFECDEDYQAVFEVTPAAEISGKHSSLPFSCCRFVLVLCVLMCPSAPSHSWKKKPSSLSQSFLPAVEMGRNYRWENTFAAGTFAQIVDTTQETAKTGQGRTDPDLQHRDMSLEGTQKTSEKFSSPDPLPSAASVNTEQEQSGPSHTSNNVTNHSGCSPRPPYCNASQSPLQISIGRCLWFYESLVVFAI